MCIVALASAEQIDGGEEVRLWNQYQELLAAN
jgi:hypothetical protein